MSWKFCVLGTKAGGAPLARKSSSATALMLPGETLLFDCAENTQIQLLRAKISRADIHHIFLSHLHGDHLLGLPGLLSTFCGEKRTAALHIYAPRNQHHPEYSLEQWVELSWKLMDVTPTFPIAFHDLPEGFAGEVLRTPQYVVTAQMLEHRITSFGFRVEELPQINFDLDKVRAVGLEVGAVLGELKRQGQVRTSAGRVVTLAEVCLPQRKSQSFVYCGDTKVCSATIALAQNADVLLHEATFGDEMAAQAAERFHCTAAQTAAQARAAQVGKLYLTHFSVRYASVAPLLRQARKIFPHTWVAKELRIEELPEHHR
jgi:ribonuclease Z